MSSKTPSAVRTDLDSTLAPASARNAVALFGLFALAFFTLIYLISPDWYLRVITLHFFFDPPYVPPFGDLVAVMRSIECWQSGRETYFGTGPTTGGCGGFMYSPVWLRMGFLAKLVLPGGVAGMVLAVAFFLSLRWLPPVRTRAGLVVMLLATVSSACVFAVERANLDVLLFLMCLAGAALLGGTWLRRTLAYALFGAAALLKFYPIVLMFAAARERLPRLMAVAVALVLGVIVFLFVYGAELAMALRGVGALNTHWGPFTDRYGAQQLAAGLALLVTSDVAPTAAALLPGASRTDLPAPRWVTPLLVTMAVAGALWLRGRTEIGTRPTVFQPILR